MHKWSPMAFGSRQAFYNPGLAFSPCLEAVLIAHNPLINAVVLTESPRRRKERGRGLILHTRSLNRLYRRLYQLRLLPLTE
jgi:hypothetical protein